MVEEVRSRRAAIAQRHPQWAEMSLDSYLEKAVADFADRPLVITDDTSMTYAEVLGFSRQVAAAFEAFGLQPGQRVGMIMPNHPMIVPLLFAIWRLGAVAVPMNTLYRPEELEFVVRESDCALLITMERFGSRNYVADLDRHLPGWRTGECAAAPGLRSGLIFDPADPHAFYAPFYEGRQSTAPSLGKPSDPAVIMFTSGTTGSPKGVVQTHDNLLRAAYAGALHQAFEDGRRAIFSLPLYHGFGLVVGLLSGLVVGGAIIPHLKFDPPAILSAIGRHRATFLMGVPTMTIALMEQAVHGTYDFSSPTAIHSAAAPTPSWVWEKIQQTFGCDEIFTSYGQTETTATIVCTQPGDPIDIVSTTQGCIVEAGVAGIAAEGGRIAEFKTIDPETGADLPPGSAGELCTRGPMNSLGYFRRPEETAKIMLPGGWIRMGDLGQFRPDGNLFITGRTKEVYKSRGELVSPKELEQLLTTHPDILQAFLIGMPDDRWGECGCAWIVRADGARIEAEDVMRFLEPRVARYKLPRDIWFIEASDLPTTGTGKVQKNRLKAMAETLLAGEQA